MRRREFISLLGGALVYPSVASGQDSIKRSLIAWMFCGSSVALVQPYKTALLGRLQELGYVEGQEFDIVYQSAEGDASRMRGLADELVRLKPDIIVTGCVPAVLALKEVTTAIPILCASLQDPVAAGLVESFAHPGGNVTGIATNLDTLQGKRLELVREIIPAANRIGLLVNTGNPTHAMRRRETEAAASKLAMQIFPVETRLPADLDKAFQTLAEHEVEMVIVLLDFMFLGARHRIAKLAEASRLPTVYAWREHVEAGGLMSYGTDVRKNYVQLADFVAKILKGAKPSDLPVELPTKLELLINLKTAKALGVTIPQSILLRADEVIE